MFKSTLGLGTKLGAGINSNQTDLNLYLNSLRKKQREVKKKHARTKSEEEAVKDDTVTEGEEEDDSDLASLAREFAKDEIQQSPFLKRRTDEDSRRLSQASISGGTPLPEKDAPFVTSLVKEVKQQQQGKNTGSAALNSFMKFDRKYAGRVKEVEKESDTEPESESVFQPPPPQQQSIGTLRIASELANKIRSRRPSVQQQDPKMIEEDRAVSAASGRLKQQAEDRNLRLTIPMMLSPRAAAARKPSPDLSSSATPVMTTSEVSELPMADEMHSPVYNIEDLLDADELDDRSSNFSNKASNVVIDLAQEIKEEFKLEEGDQDSSESTLKEVHKVEKVTEHQPKDRNSKTRKETISRKSLHSPNGTAPSQEDSNTERSETKIARSGKRDKRKSRRRDSSSSRCYYCAQLCTFHRHNVVNDPTSMHHPAATNASSRRSTMGEDKHVQVGSPQLRDVDHYLFDPSRDYHYSGSSHRKEPSCVRKYAIPPSLSSSSVNKALADMMRAQLELTEKFLQGQKTLHLQYCDMIRERTADKILYPRRPHTSQSSQNPRGHRTTGSTKDHISGSLDITESVEEVEDEQIVDYESDFESAVVSAAV